MRWLFFLLSVSALSAEVTDFDVHLGRTWNDGSTIFEIGSKQPDITGVAGGSRITYPRCFAYTTGGVTFFLGHASVSADFGATGHALRSGTGRDEDFFLYSTSREDGAKVSVQDGRFKDSAYVFSGGKNWADSRGKISLVEYRGRVSTRVSPWSASNPFEHESGAFFLMAYEHVYSKYRFYDAVQYNAVPVISVGGLPFSLTPIGTGLSFTNVAGEGSIGAGAAWHPSRVFGFEVSFAPSLGYADSRDFHSLRGITFIMHSAGAGFQYSLDSLIFPREDLLLRLSLTGHRMYARGNVRARGLDLLYNFAPPQQMYLNTKEWGAQMSAELRL